MDAFVEWRKKWSWMPLPADHSDLDVENKLLYQDDTETSNRRPSDNSEDIQPLLRRNIFGSNKSWLFLTIINMLLVCVSVILNKNTFWNFERSCIKETSAYCTVSPEALT